MLWFESAIKAGLLGSLGGKSKVEPAFRRNVPTHIEIHDVARKPEIIRPFEINAGFVALQTKRFAWNRQLQLIAQNSPLHRGHFYPLPTTRVFFEPEFSVRVTRAVDDEIIASPAGLRILVGVNQQPHPVRVRGWCQRRNRSGVKIKVRRIARDFAGGELIAAR